MKRFIFALHKELIKLAHHKKYIVLLALGILVSIIRRGGAALVTRLSGGIVSVKANMPLEMLPFAVEILVPVMMFIAVSDLFTREYSEDTLKASLMQPVSRFKLLSAKAAAVVILGAVSLMVMYIANTLIHLASGGTSSGAASALAAYLIDIIPLIGIAFLGIFINVSLKGPTSATLLSLAVYALMKYMGLYVAGSESFLFTAGAKLHVMLLGSALPLHVLLNKTGILLGSILILYSLSYIIFDKKNV
ncbi:MAG: ABC transporter permease [Candidatus Ornithomonoglobus sp.]